MSDFNLQSLEHVGLQIFELVVSFPRTLAHLVVRPRRVFASLVDPGDGTQEVYGDGDIGYTSPLLFAITAMVLQLVVDWSTSYVASAQGMSSDLVSYTFVAYAAQFTFFVFVTALFAARALGGERTATTLHRALYVGCYASGIGLLRTTAFTAAQWMSFLGSAARGDGSKTTLVLGALFTMAGGAFLLWQLAAVTFEFVVVLSLRVRTAVWVMVKSVATMVPVYALLFVVAAPGFTVTIGRLTSAWEAAQQDKPQLALDHVAWLAGNEEFHGSRASLALQQLQLETYTYRRWLPVYERVHERMQRLRSSIDVTSAPSATATTAVRNALKWALRSVDQENLSTAPMLIVTDPAALKPKLGAVRTRIAASFLSSRARPHWPFPHPVYLTIAVTNSMGAAGIGLSGTYDPALLRERLDHLLLCLDVGMLTMLERLTTVDERLPRLVDELAPAQGMYDVYMALMVAIAALKS